jgi:hypothetical protein
MPDMGLLDLMFVLRGSILFLVSPLFVLHFPFWNGNAHAYWKYIDFIGAHSSEFALSLKGAPELDSNIAQSNVGTVMTLGTLEDRPSTPCK